MKFDLHLPPMSKLISQPPADSVLGDAAMFHYTWGTIWSDASGKEVWKFDKRFYTDAKLELEVMSRIRCGLSFWSTFAQQLTGSAQRILQLCR